MKRRLWAVILTLAMTLPLTGCIGTVSIGERLLVQAMGIDGGPEGFTITLQVFTPAPAGQQQGGSTGTVSASDENLAECLSKIYRDTGKRPFFRRLPSGAPWKRRLSRVPGGGDRAAPQRS